METKTCNACGCTFTPRPQNPNQKYCTNSECQRERRRRWQQQKRRDDADYRDNDVRAAKAWAIENPEYWKQYRDENPAYAERKKIYSSSGIETSDLCLTCDLHLPARPLLQGTLHSPGAQRNRTNHQRRIRHHHPAQGPLWPRGASPRQWGQPKHVDADSAQRDGPVPAPTPCEFLIGMVSVCFVPTLPAQQPGE